VVVVVATGGVEYPIDLAVAMEVACATLAPSLQNRKKFFPVAGPVGAVDNRILANWVIQCAVVQGLWRTTARTLKICSRVRVVVHSPAASTGLHARGDRRAFWCIGIPAPATEIRIPIEARA
jgi:hypothetical protein